MPPLDSRDAIEMSRLNEFSLDLDSLRSSLDEDCFARQHCEVVVQDDVPVNLEGSTTPDGKFLRAFSRHRTRDTQATTQNVSDSNGLQGRLDSRDATRTRWVNIIGWSRSVVDTVSQHHLGNHGCLDLENLSQQVLGGPTRAQGETDFIWIQTQMWFIGDRPKRWSSMRTIKFRMIICLPTPSQAGTLITNFAGPLRLAKEVSSYYVKGIIDQHPLERGALACPWILAFAMLRMMAEQLNFAFEIFDPAEITQSNIRIPRLDELPGILGKANHLALISRYLSRIEEFTAFFLSAQNLLQIASPKSSSNLQRERPYCLDQVKQVAKFEAERARQKVFHQQNLCRSFIAPFDNLIQITISYSTAEITKRLDAGSHVAEKIAKIGLIIAAITGIVSPLSLVTGYYGMNVREFNPGASGTLYDFWTISLPILLFSIVVSTFLWLWLYADAKN